MGVAVLQQIGMKPRSGNVPCDAPSLTSALSPRPSSAQRGKASFFVQIFPRKFPEAGTFATGREAGPDALPRRKVEPVSAHVLSCRPSATRRKYTDLVLLSTETDVAVPR